MGVQGKKDPGVSNALEDLTLHEQLEAAEQMKSLIEHEGWLIVERFVDQAYDRGTDQLVRSGLKDQAEYASRLGVLNGIRFHRDVVVTVLAKAETARVKLMKNAEREATAERS